jgi:hypothetical protein
MLCRTERLRSAERVAQLQPLLKFDTAITVSTCRRSSTSVGRASTRMQKLNRHNIAEIVLDAVRKGNHRAAASGYEACEAPLTIG